MEEFAVVHFLDEKKGYSEVPKNLLVISENKNECWWPDVKDPNSLITKSVSPNSRGFKWSKFEVEVVCLCETLDRASTIAELLMKEHHYNSSLEKHEAKGSKEERDGNGANNNSKNTPITFHADYNSSLEKHEARRLKEEEDGINANKTNGNESSNKLNASLGNDVANVKSESSPIQPNKIYNIMWFDDTLPLKEAKDLEDFNGLLKKDIKLQNSFRKYLIQIGGKNVTEHLNGILKIMFNDELAATYSDKEKADSIFQLLTMKFIFDVLCKIKHFSTTTKALENLSLEYFFSIKNM